MAYESVVISSGHGKYVRGASGILDEVDEARRVVDCVAGALRARGVTVKVFHDNTSHNQSDNLETIVDYHNAQQRDLDVSVHFNAYEQTSSPRGVEVLYVTQSQLAAQVSAEIASVGFVNRGPKKNNDLYFLNNTEQPAILIEVCFVDSQADADLYQGSFLDVCDSIADVLGGQGIFGWQPPDKPENEYKFEATGACSTFGGPDDTGVAPDEGLALAQDIENAPHLFLPYQPAGSSGLARRLNPHTHYVACRWDYGATSKDSLLEDVALVTAAETGISLRAFPINWGPNENTGRVADLSPSLMQDLGISTDGEVTVVFPYKE